MCIFNNFKIKKSTDLLRSQNFKYFNSFKILTPVPSIKKINYIFLLKKVN